MNKDNLLVNTVASTNDSDYGINSSKSVSPASNSDSTSKVSSTSSLLNQPQNDNQTEDDQNIMNQLGNKYLKPELELNSKPKPFVLKKADENKNNSQVAQVETNRVYQAIQLNINGKHADLSKSDHDKESQIFSSNLNAYSNRRNSSVTRTTNGRDLLKMIENQMNNSNNNVKKSTVASTFSKNLPEDERIKNSFINKSPSYNSQRPSFKVEKSLLLSDNFKISENNSKSTATKKIFNDKNNNMLNVYNAAASNSNGLNMNLKSVERHFSREKELATKYSMDQKIRGHVARLDDPNKPSVVQSRTFKLLQDTLDNGKFKKQSRMV